MRDYEISRKTGRGCMFRVSGVTMAWAMAAIMAFCGCSAEQDSSAMAISEPNHATALARAAEDMGDSARGAARTETSIATGEEPAQIPETADAALRAVLNGLHENHPEALWDAMPASYQRDVNGLVHLFAGRMHPEAWKW